MTIALPQTCLGIIKRCHLDQKLHQYTHATFSLMAQVQPLTQTLDLETHFSSCRSATYV
jgi:hypothetical protein